jgi:F-type H+-transporting ATPase subunit b
MSARRAWIFLFAAILLLAPAAPAAEEGGHGDITQSFVGWVFRWINTGIIFAGLIWAFRKLRGKFRSNAERIASSINLAAQTKADAEKKLREAEEKLAHLEQEAAEMRAAAQREAAAEAARIRAAAESEAQKIAHAAEEEIAAAERSARIELRALAARLSVERAEAQIRNRMTPDAQSAIFRAFVEQLAGSVN